MTMELRHLEHFVAVAEERSFTRAATRIHLVQSALSVSVRSLERDLGARLFDRTTHEVRLTDAGRALLPEARRTLEAAAGARAAVTTAEDGMRGTLRLGLMQSLSLVDVAAWLADFHRQRPEVEIRPRPAGGGSQSLADDVRDGELDAAFVSMGGLRGQGLEVSVLASEPLFLTCTADHRLATQKTVSLRDIREESFVDFPVGWGIRTVGDRLFAEAGLERLISVEVPDVTTVLALVRAGLGVALMPRSMIRLAPELRLVELRPAAFFEVGFVVSSQRPPSPVTRAFSALVHQQASSAAQP
jgi:DNA-binding transcriptional LysR family regulator